MAYVPKKDSVFAVWVSALILYVQPRLAAFNIPDAVFQPIFALYTAWGAAYAKYLEPNRGPVDVADKNRARKALEKPLRDFIKAFLLYSPFVSDKDRNEMGLPIYGKKSTPVPPPATVPEYDIDTSVRSRLTVRFWDGTSKRKAKPRGVHGAEVRWELRDTAPEKEEDLRNSDISTRTPHTLVFTSDKQGRRVYCCLRWENGTGEKGPWGVIMSAVVP